MEAETYNQLKRAVENRKAEYDREQGAYRQVMSQLKEEFGCKTLEEARLLLKRKQTKLDRKTKDFEHDLKRFVRKYKDVLR